MGANALRCSGLLNGYVQDALADPGSSVLIMDEDFAQAAGLTVSESQSNRRRLRFADNTTAIISGMTFGVKWEFGDWGVRRA
jgi:hypothetical protein